MDLGFADGATAPVLAAELATSQRELTEAFEYRDDVKVLRRLVWIDFGFIAAYSGLFAAMGCRWRAGSRERRHIVLLSIVTAVLDIAENGLLLQALGSEVEVWLLRYVSLAKWACFFTMALILGFRLMLESVNSSLAACLRIMICILICLGALGGLSYFLFWHGLLIQNGAMIVALGLSLLPLWLWNPDGAWVQTPKP